MTRRTVMTCDRCGSDFDQGALVDVNRTEVTGDGYVEGRWGDIGCEGVLRQDLCLPCALALQTWLTEPGGERVD